MTKAGTFYINENMRLNSKHFCLLMHKVDYDVLLLESKSCKPGREIYSKSGTISILAEFDMTELSKSSILIGLYGATGSCNHGCANYSKKR